MIYNLQNKKNLNCIYAICKLHKATIQLFPFIFFLSTINKPYLIFLTAAYQNLYPIAYKIVEKSEHENFRFVFTLKSHKISKFYF